MKTSQKIGLFVVIIGVVFVVTFVSQWTSPPDRPIGPVSGPPPVTKLVFPETEAANPVTTELQGTGFHDFYFQNPAATAVEIGVDYQSCRCSKVEVFTFTPEEEKIFQQGNGTRSWSTASSGALPLVCVQAALDEEKRGFLADAKRWQAADVHEKTSATVPAQSSGLVRVGWSGKQEGPQRMKVILWSQPRGDDRSRATTPLEIPVMIVAPLSIQQPATAALSAPLQENGKNTVSFLCWSMTRPTFDLQVADNDKKDRCFEYTLIPLSGAQCREQLGEKFANAAIASGYRVQVTVHERRNGKRLDLGPFRRKIELTSDAQSTPLIFEISGSILGDVRLLTATGSQRISLGDFEVSEGKETSVMVEADRSDMKVSVGSRYPDYLEAELSELSEEEQKDVPAGKKHWKLKVRVPKNRGEGKLPADAAIVLTIDGSRGIRIPVLGHATLSNR